MIEEMVMTNTKIKYLIQEDSTYKPGASVMIQGWVRTLRDQKQFAFIELNDGSCLANIQVILKNDLPNYSDIIATVSTGAALKIEGHLVESPGKGQNIEIAASKIEIVGLCDESYPLQKKRHSFEFLRTIAHLRARTNTLGAVSRIRNALFFSSHRFFQERDFISVQTPIITASDCEGAGEMFRVTTLKEGEKDPANDFFGKSAYLTVSGQLNAEAYALALSNVYTFGPTFRAENSNTSRHLAEFWMLEPEVAFSDLKDIYTLAQDYLQYVLRDLLNHHMGDLSLFNQFVAPGLIEKLEQVATKPFEILEYTEAVRILEKTKHKFEFPIYWGVDLQSEHERYLVEEHFKGPAIVINYPKQIKAFYMRNNEDGKTCAAMDVLCPGIGEMIGGSQREERYDVLVEKIQSMKLDVEAYQWYLDLRRFGGVPHAGFGLGFERLIQYATGMENIRDVIPFPRAPKQAEF